MNTKKEIKVNPYLEEIKNSLNFIEPSLRIDIMCLLDRMFDEMEELKEELALSNECLDLSNEICAKYSNQLSKTKMLKKQVL